MLRVLVKIALHDLLPPKTPLELFDDVHWWDLVRDLEANGMIEPPVVAWHHGWSIIEGERRCYAWRWLGHKHVTCEDCTDD